MKQPIEIIAVVAEAAGLMNDDKACMAFQHWEGPALTHAAAWELAVGICEAEPGCPGCGGGRVCQAGCRAD